MTVMTVWGAVYGLGPFADRGPQDAARDMQLFLCAVAVPLLMLAVALEQGVRLERESLEQRRQVSHLSRVAMLGELSGGIAHELNQPLTAILSNAQAAQHLIANKSATSESLAEILQDIITADKRAGEVIRRLHALFRRGETQFDPLDMNDVVHEVLAIVRGEMVMRSIEVTTHLGDGMPAVRGDRVELQQVLLNLVMNACEAMRAVTAPDARRLLVRTRAAEDGVMVTVTDEGPGFAPKTTSSSSSPSTPPSPRAWASAFPSRGRSSVPTAVACGAPARRARAPPSTSCCPPTRRADRQGLIGPAYAFGPMGPWSNSSLRGNLLQSPDCAAHRHR
jgi:signal transduction histidine kinase